MKAIQNKKLEEITTLLEQLALVSKESESGPTTNAHEFINYEVEFDLNNRYTPTEEEFIGMLDGGISLNHYRFVLPLHLDAW